MKKDYKTNDKVVITKEGMFKDLTGTILTHNTDTGFKPLNVILDNNLGSWQYDYADVAPIGKEKSIKIDHKIVEPEASNKLENLTVATTEKPKKRKYKKRVTPKEVKPKRKYTRKEVQK